MSELKDRRAYRKETTDKKKELGDQTKKQDITVKDKVKSADAAGRLRQEGTREGAQRIRRAMEQAGKAIDQQMDGQKGQHDRMSDAGKREEEKVKRSSDSAKQDAKTAESAARDVKTEGGRRAIIEAQKGAEEDGKFLDDVKKTRQKDREASMKKTMEQIKKVKGTKVKTRR